MKIAALKIYCDSIRGYRDGIPRLLDVLDCLGVPASIFFGMGTEDDGGMVSRIFREEREIVGSAPGIIRDAFRRGFDCGIYGWNPREWESRLDKIRDTTLEADLKRAADLFFRRTGSRPTSSAAPGCRVSYISMRIQDDLQLLYASDTFGQYPFFPRMSWKTFETPQIPSTIPPLEIVMRKVAPSAMHRSLTSLRESLPDGLSVIPMNASLGLTNEFCAALSGFIERSLFEGTRFLSLAQVIMNLGSIELPSCEVRSADAYGTPHEVAIQVPD